MLRAALLKQNTKKLAHKTCGERARRFCLPACATAAPPSRRFLGGSPVSPLPCALRALFIYFIFLLLSLFLFAELSSLLERGARSVPPEGVGSAYLPPRRVASRKRLVGNENEPACDVGRDVTLVIGRQRRRVAWSERRALSAAPRRLLGWWLAAAVNQSCCRWVSSARRLSSGGEAGLHRRPSLGGGVGPGLLSVSPCLCVCASVCALVSVRADAS